MLYHPSTYILIANIVLICVIKYDKIFKTISVAYPILALASLLASKGAQSFEILGLKFLFDSQLNCKIIGCAFLITSLAVNLYAVSQNKKLEVIVGGFYLGYSIVCLLADDFISIFISLELMLITASILIFVGDDKNSIFAVKQYFLTHIFSGSLIFTGMCYFINETGSTEITNITNFFYASKQSTIAACLILTGCLINAAAFPFSSWIINCYAEASSKGFLYLSTFTIKVSIILIVKLFSGLEILKYFGIIMMLYGVIYACIESNLRRLFCYLSISQMGFILTVVSTGSEVAIQSAVLFLAIHIIYKLILGLYTAIITDYLNIKTCDGLATYNLPILNFAFGIGFMFLINFPFSASFMSKIVISEHVENINLACTQQILNVITFLSLPLRQVFQKQNTHNININYGSRIALLIPLVSLTILNIYLIYHFLISNRFSFTNHSSEIFLKQTVVVIIGTMLAYFINLPRIDTRKINIDLLVFVSSCCNYLLNSYKNSRSITKDKFEFKSIEIKVLESFGKAHSQSAATGIIFLMLIITLLIQIRG